ncbi:MULTISPECIES: methylamine dehydrogenase accessory protein MauD [Zoogloea]|jgi:methylamine dehydrogenase accessory protein MauD|uniref:Methylamine utilization protein MauD n=1 Tax=Zoogloea oleivorans TaxID=1552750 RepID=A0A6C2CNQ9_9RHOO|nr:MULTISPECIES: methylamine dehydrogenase accessory protein MauD [Zoogloea]MBT9496206.1 methylamine dehydrogenase accessory protein MauD [Zoogloea sp.]MDD2669796.1 methylamine dehydrogenase accessory protein MauD [Zoogloea sp.]MDY0036331.1 methylamine dehydrogenase accessory protein MauD [Zoogloea oleivorans]TYC55083.1 methylamine dehydrogenase accessory protein MauD [Zoogloea oleivorans]
MNEALMISNVLLWVAVLAALVGLFALARQIGVLYERVAPMGALMMDTGPKVGEASPVFDLPDLIGSSRVSIGRPGEKSTLLFFLSPTCPVCKKLLPILRSVNNTEKDWLRVVLTSDGEQPEHLAFYEKADLKEFPYVLSSEPGIAYRVAKLPYAVLLNEHGRVVAKGLVNSREQLESLFTAKELGVASVQEFIDHQHA